jgi:hypothetical protein
MTCITVFCVDQLLSIRLLVEVFLYLKIELLESYWYLFFPWVTDVL